MKWIGLVLVLASCSDSGGADRIPVEGREGAFKTAALQRATRRSYDGAPPVIPHENFRSDCAACHNERGMDVPDVGFAPPNPHESTEGMSATSRCKQCHVFRVTEELFVASTFEGLLQDLLPGERAHDNAPPVVPHPLFMRENCLACHSGPAAREEIRTTHPERGRCTQCHVPAGTSAPFRR